MRSMFGGAMLVASSLFCLAWQVSGDQEGLLLERAAKMGETIKRRAEEEMGLEDIFFEEKGDREGGAFSAQDEAERLASLLGRRASVPTGVVAEAAKRMGEFFSSKEELQLANSSPSPSPSCCSLRTRGPPRDWKEVNPDSCSVGDLSSFLASNLTSAMMLSRSSASSSSSSSYLRWQFFLSPDLSSHLLFPSSHVPCGLRSDSLHRSVALAALHGRPKRVVLLFDRAAGGDAAALDLGRAAVRYVLSTLEPTDLLGFVAAAGETVYHPLGADCPLTRMAPATSNAKLEVLKFINVVQASRSSTDHAQAIAAVGALVRNSDHVNRDSVVHVLYLSAGGTVSEEQMERAETALEAVHSGTTGQIVFSGYYLGGSGGESDSGTELLKKLTYYSGAGSSGRFVKLSRPENLAEEVGDYLAGADVPLRDTLSVLLSWDAVGHELVLSFATTAKTEDGKLAGVTGIDMDATSFLQDFLFYQGEGEGSPYACLLEKVGSQVRVVYHPKTYNRQNPSVPEALLGDVEDVADDSDLISRMLAVPFDSKSVGTKHFSWRWVENLDYIAVIVTDTASQVPHASHFWPYSNRTEQESAVSHLYFHRLDLLPSKEQPSLLCLQNSRFLSTMMSGTIFLTPSAFSSPHQDLQEELAGTFQSYLAYLNDRTGLISNPGLATEVKEELLAISQLIPLWKRRALSQGPRKVMDRFAAALSGIQVSYPGAVFPENFDFGGMKWFRTALRFPDKLVISGPFLHPTEVGYAITLSKAVLSSKGEARAVVAVNVPMGFLAEILFDLMPECQEGKIRCFLFDQGGVLAFHPIMTDPSYTGPIEDQHLNHKEPNVGKDLLTHFGDGAFVRKHFCKSFLDKTVRRQYSYKVDLEGDVISGKVHGSLNSNCSQYSVTPLDGTNVLLGVVRSSCPVAAVFCPCSINSRKCIVCEQNKEEALGSCECPCECPLELLDSCPSSKHAFMSRHDLSVCDEEGAITCELAEKPRANSGVPLPNCFEEQPCKEAASKLDCLALVGCSWCEAEVTAVDEGFSSQGSAEFSPLERPYCAQSRSCYSGAVGSPGPYRHWRDAGARGKLLRRRGPASSPSSSSSSSSSSDHHQQRPSPIGPVVGGILVFFLFLVFSAFCYRHRLSDDDGTGCGPVSLHRGNRRTQSRGRRVVSNIEVDEEEELREMQQAIAVASGGEAGPQPQNPVIISPYRMNPGYSRPAPPPGADSDYGYSTMTPTVINGGGASMAGGADADGDSEVIVPYTASEAARSRLTNRQYHRTATVAAASVTSGVSSRTPSPLPSSSATQSRRLRSHLEREVGQGEEEEETAMFVSEKHSESSSHAAPTYASASEQTVLTPNQIIVAATVHEVDTA